MTNTIPNLSQTPLPPQKCHCGKGLFITTYMSNPPQYAYDPCSCTYKIMTNNNEEGWIEAFYKEFTCSILDTNGNIGYREFIVENPDEVVDFISTLLANYKATLSKKIEGKMIERLHIRFERTSDSKLNEERKAFNDEVTNIKNYTLQEVLNIINK